MTNEAYRDSLNRIAEVHRKPDPAQKVDALCQRLDRDKLLPFLTGPRVLELGSGDGVWTEAVIERFGESFVVDGSESLLRDARARFGDQLNIYESYFETFVPPESITFDTILATHILEHVDDPALVLKRTRNWLSPGGRVIVVVPNATSLHRRIGVRMGILESVYQLSERDHVVGHQRVLDLPALRELATTAGFEIVAERGFMIKVLSNAQMADFPEELIRAFVDVSEELPPEFSCNVALVLQAS